MSLILSPREQSLFSPADCSNLQFVESEEIAREHIAWTITNGGDFEEQLHTLGQPNSGDITMLIEIYSHAWRMSQQ